MRPHILLFLVGFDSDDEFQDGDRRHAGGGRNIRHVKGKKYASLPADDPVDAAYFRVRNVYYPPNYSRFASRVERDDADDAVKHAHDNNTPQYLTNSDLHTAETQRPSHAHNFSSTISQSRYRTENSTGDKSTMSQLDTSSSTSEHYSRTSGEISGETLSSPISGANMDSYYSTPDGRDDHQVASAPRETYRIPEDSEEEDYMEEVFHKPSAYIRQRGEGGGSIIQCLFISGDGGGGGRCVWSCCTCVWSIESCDLEMT